ncbi:MAG: alcohol dehydrogenase [Verrucomicrobia bacterium]|nr:alcohol dehydrogenase [Verrucomicrobiota bacterium]
MPVFPKSLVLPPRTISGGGTVRDLLTECGAYGSRGVLVHGGSLERSGALARITSSCPDGVILQSWKYSGSFEPTLDDVESLLAVVRKHDAMWVAGVGGGSVMDIAKAGAGLKNAPLPVLNYHEGAKIPCSRIPFIAVPTTAGTGSEATSVCVFMNPVSGEKKSFRHPSFMAGLVILDSELLRDCPPGVIAASGMDALTQAIESFVSRGATWFSDECALKATGLIAANLVGVWKDASGPGALAMLEGSFLAGIALANARLGLVHGLAHPLGARFKVPHGLACAVCLPAVLDFNRPAIGAKYKVLSDVLGGDAVSVVRHFLAELRISSPFAVAAIADRKAVIRETLASGSTAANPREVAAEDVGRIMDLLFAAAS